MKTEQFNTGKALTSIAGTILFYFFLCVRATQVQHPLFPRFRRLTLSLSAITLSDLNADISDSGSNNATKFLDFTSYDLRFHSKQQSRSHSERHLIATQNGSDADNLNLNINNVYHSAPQYFPPVPLLNRIQFSCSLTIGRMSKVPPGTFRATFFAIHQRRLISTILLPTISILLTFCHMYLLSLLFKNDPPTRLLEANLCSNPQKSCSINYLLLLLQSLLSREICPHA